MQTLGRAGIYASHGSDGVYICFPRSNGYTAHRVGASCCAQVDVRPSLKAVWCRDGKASNCQSSQRLQRGRKIVKRMQAVFNKRMPSTRE